MFCFLSKKNLLIGKFKCVKSFHHSNCPFAGIERSWTVADESPGGTETTIILNDFSSSDGATPVFDNEQA